MTKQNAEFEEWYEILTELLHVNNLYTINKKDALKHYEDGENVFYIADNKSHTTDLLCVNRKQELK